LKVNKSKLIKRAEWVAQVIKRHLDQKNQMVVPYFKPLEVQAPKKTIAEQIDKPLPVAKAYDGSKK
jgi:hemerythrin-like domain-containing protein